MTTTNLFYYDPKRIDLSKLRAQATLICVGDSRNGPEDAIIHFHDHDDPCTGIRHERYKAREPLDEKDTPLEDQPPFEVYTGE